jgi:hypothetical protein
MLFADKNLRAFCYDVHAVLVVQRNLNEISLNHSSVDALSVDCDQRSFGEDSRKQFVKDAEISGNKNKNFGIEDRTFVLKDGIFGTCAKTFGTCPKNFSIKDETSRGNLPHRRRSLQPSRSTKILDEHSTYNR